MNILLTNDDGIHAQGLAAIYQELSQIGKVTVVAPDSERSSIGHGITLTQPLWAREVRHDDLFCGTALSGTPADCVKFGILEVLKGVPDLVVSGINTGPNDGLSVFYSGTVAGAREGAFWGAQSLAVSVASFENVDFSYAAKIGAQAVKQLFENPLAKGTFLNINVPACRPEDIKGICMTRQGKALFQSRFLKGKSPYQQEYFWLSADEPAKGADQEQDSCALADGYVTVTPLQSDLTDETALDYIKKINFLL